MDQSSKVLLLTCLVQTEGNALPYVRFCFLHGTVLWMSRLTQVMQAGKKYLVIWKENKNYLIWAANVHKDKWWNTIPINDTCYVVPLLTAQEVTSSPPSETGALAAQAGSSTSCQSTGQSRSSPSRTTLASAVFWALANLIYNSTKKWQYKVIGNFLLIFFNSQNILIHQS